MTEARPTIPSGFRVRSDGVFALKSADPIDNGDRFDLSPATPSDLQNARLVVPAPLWVLAAGDDIDDGDRWFKLRVGGARGFECWLPLQVVSSRTLTIAALGSTIPLPDSGLSALSDYLAASVQALPEAAANLKVRARFGLWGGAVGEFGVSLPPAEWIGPGQVEVVAESALHLGSRISLSPGDPEAELARWLAVFRTLTPIQRFVTCVSFASLLIRLVDWRSFWFHHAGRSNSGKSALQRLGGSVWGPGEKYTDPMNATANWLSSRCREADGLPVILDELQAASEGLKRQMSDAIYQVIMGRDKGRSTREGYVRKTESKPWKLILWSSGEQELTATLSVRGGVANRVIEFSGDELMPDADAKRINVWTGRWDAPYGHPGRAWARWLLAPGNVNVARELLADLGGEVGEHMPDGNQTRTHVAIVATAYVLVHRLWAKQLGVKLAGLRAEALALAIEVLNRSSTRKTDSTKEILERLADALHSLPERDVIDLATEDGRIKWQQGQTQGVRLVRGPFDSVAQPTWGDVSSLSYLVRAQTLRAIASGDGAQWNQWARHLHAIGVIKGDLHTRGSETFNPRLPNNARLGPVVRLYQPANASPARKVCTPEGEPHVG